MATSTSFGRRTSSLRESSVLSGMKVTVSANGRIFAPNTRMQGVCVTLFQAISRSVSSATLPAIVLNDVMNILHMRKDNTYIMERTNDHHNISFCFCELLHRPNSTWR